MDEERTVRIGNLGAVAVVALAALFDLVQLFGTLLVATILLAPVGFVLSFVAGLAAYFALFLVFKLAFKGVKVLGGKSGYMKLLAVFGALVVEVIPLLQALPGITMFALTIIVATRIEDTLGEARSLERLVGRRTRERTRLDKRQQDRLEEAKKRDEDKNTGTTQAQQKKQNEKERKQYDRKVARQNAGMVARAAFGVPRTQRLDRNRQVINERQAAPGMLQEDVLEETGLSGFDDPQSYERS